MTIVTIVTVYYVVLITLYLILGGLAWRGVRYRKRMRDALAIDQIFASPLTPPISVILPARDEEAGIVESVRSLLAIRYRRFEVIVVDDGSQDATFARLEAVFELVPVRRFMRDSIPTKPLIRTYASASRPELIVIRKENGGKADALNAGINAAHYSYFCAVDADTIVEENALLWIARSLIQDPERVVAVGGMVRIGNGATVVDAKLEESALPLNRLVVFQVVEYLRAFLLGRVGWARLGELFIISGAFGVFRRDIVEEMGGYDTTIVGEDVELVARIHRRMRHSQEAYKIDFVSEATVWTEVPEDLGSLARQRRRWQRGLAEALWGHRRVIANFRYGSLGMLTMPYQLLFELMGPLVELLGLVAVTVGILTGTVDLALASAFFAAAIAFGALLSIGGVAIEEMGFARFARWQDLARLIGYSAIDNLGFRQLLNIWRIAGILEFLAGEKQWGAVTKAGLTERTSQPPLARATSSA